MDGRVRSGTKVQSVFLFMIQEINGNYNDVPKEELRVIFIFVI